MSREANVEHAPAGVPIFINKLKFTLAMPVSGAQLRTLGNIPANNQLFLEVSGSEQDQLIDPNRTYDLKPGSHLYDLPVGTVGASALEEQIAYARAHLEGAVTARQADGVYVVRWPVRLHDPWSPTSVTLIVMIPPLFPAQAPSGFDTAGAMTRSGGGVGGAAIRQMGEEQWMHFCWNPAGTLDYSAEDGIWRFAKFAESRFLIQQ